MIDKIYNTIKNKFIKLYENIWSPLKTKSDSIKITYTGLTQNKNSSYTLTLSIINNSSVDYIITLDDIFNSVEFNLLKQDILKIVKNSFFVIMTTVFTYNENNQLITFSIPNLQNLKFDEIDNEILKIKNVISLKLMHYQAHKLSAVSFVIFIK